MTVISPPKARPNIVIRRHGPMFTMTPPTTAFANMLVGAEAELHSQKAFATFEKALGFAVGLAVSYNWEIREETGTIDREGIGLLMAAPKAGVI